MNKKIKIGISKCLLGEKVRYDGQHKLDHFIVDTLGKYLEFVPVCPEVECGLPVPREAMHLVGTADSPRLVTVKSRKDITAQMQKWMAPKIEELKQENLCGFIFKSKSPSSGMTRVKIYSEDGKAVMGTGSGIFAAALMKNLPLLPVEDEGRLHDPVLRENFIERIFVMQRWNEMLENDCTASGLVDFHTRHKLLVMSHKPELYSVLGRFVAKQKELGLEVAMQQYYEQLVVALQNIATPATHVNVLQHIMGYFKALLSHDEKLELLELMERMREGIVPLIVPVTLINHYVNKYEIEYLKIQYYLQPHPLELKLRNHC